MTKHPRHDLPIEEWVEAYNREWAELRKQDQKARDEGKIVGRYLQYQVADGHATYIVESVNDDGTVMVSHWYGTDGYRKDLVEYFGLDSVPMKLVKEHLEQRDRFEDWWESTSK